MGLCEGERESIVVKIDTGCDSAKYVPNFVDATDSMIEMAKPGDVIMTLGAGDVSSLGPIIVDGLTKRFASN